jgi:N-acetylglucosaminyldiphosphoundecaprenol N-acetyl-beta-D-mannosaminyltransferase
MVVILDKLPTLPLLGKFHFSVAPLATVAEWLWEQATHEHISHWVVTANPEVVEQALASPDGVGFLHKATCLVPDGAGVVWALRRVAKRTQAKTLPTRVPGVELAEALLARCAQHGQGVALLGASPQVMEALPTKLADRLGQAVPLVFTHHGFFKAGDEAMGLALQAAKARPRLVLVALGVPRQEAWIAAHQHLFADGTLLMGVGGSFDVWAGVVKRAPKLMQRLNLEWAWRLALQPWRLQRSLPPLLRFVGRVLLRG